MKRREFEQARQALSTLQKTGVPVFFCRLKAVSGKEAGLPTGWPTVSASDYALSDARPGDAFCVVTGRGVDVIDVDPKNGADLNAVADLLLDLEAPIVASVRTPSGGAHYYVPSTGLKGLRMPRGVDYLGEGQMAYAPPTQRPKYPGTCYRWISTPDTRMLKTKRASARAAVLALALSSEGRAGATRVDATLITQIQDPDTGAAIVRSAPKGSRNDRLFAVAATLVGRGWNESTVIDALIPAAVVAGLDRREAQGTAASGAQRGRTNRMVALDWAAQARRLTGSGRRRLSSLENTIEVLVEFFCQFGWKDVTLGCRELAEKINCSAETASRRLRDLERAGALQRKQREKTGLYSDAFSIPAGLVKKITSEAKQIPRTPANVDKHLLVLRTDYSSTYPPSPDTCQQSPVLPVGRSRIIRNHSAFSRLGHGAFLPSESCSTLAAIEQGARTVQEVRQYTQMSVDAVRSHLRVLESAGLLRRLSTYPHIRFEPCWHGDVLAALDEWCESKGVAERPRLRKEYHQRQRERFRTVQEIMTDDSQLVWPTHFRRQGNPRCP